MTRYPPGSLVRCREREWVVLPSESPDLLLLRPLGGGESETTGIYLPLQRALQIDMIEEATFPPPDPALAGDAISARLLRDAARLTFRSGAGPFRSLGRISVRPRPFQIVPLLMALRLDPVRLLIADDVGIGKTIEAALIARELLDRGEARRLAVLCPPHLCEQWQRELAEKFAIEAVMVRAGTIAQLERALPPGDVSVYEHYPALVISIDFVKSERNRASFLRGCPDLVIVDEAHTAARAGSGRSTQQRHELLVDLSKESRRHLLLLTATPHSGVEDAFRSLLELLDPGFGELDVNDLSERERRKMAQHFVQRRRGDVQQWLGEETPFPKRLSREISYSLATSPEYRRLFDDIYRFARELVGRSVAGTTVWQRRVRYWTALALLRCVMSSPAAAEATLQARVARLGEGTDETKAASAALFAEYVLDLDEQEVRQDFEPTAVMEEGEEELPQNERQRLRAFARRAATLRGDGDPKARAAGREIATLLRDGFHPIVFCRYIATAEYLAEELERQLRKEFKELHVVAVTGTSSDDEREARVAELSRSACRVLVATDCLSEGINLQEHFDAVLHYDLPWNPNRLEQREGRVDRYGQAAPEVRTSLLYGTDNPIDGRVLEVLLRKAVSIHKRLGIMVPVPVNSESVVETMVRSLFEEEQPEVAQLSLFESVAGEPEEPEAGMEALQTAWDEAVEREVRSRSRFAQHAIRPQEVAQELYESDAVLGDARTVAHFVVHACERLAAPLTPHRPGDDSPRALWRLSLAALPLALRERVAPTFAPRQGATPPDEILIGFEGPVPEGAHLIGRLHPLTEALAEYLLDSALEAVDEVPPASRSGALRTAAVSRRTVLLLLRVRMLIESPGQTPLLAEELVVAGFEGHPANLTWLAPKAAQQLLEEAMPSGNLLPADRSRQLEEAVGWLPSLEGDLTQVAQERADALLQSHQRVRQATRTGRVTVRPQLPVDVLGLFVLLPVPRGAVGR